MANITGNELVAETLKRIGITDFFFIMGGPINEVLTHSMKRGIRGVDVRHEQAAAMSAHAYARVTNKPGLCMGASGPGSINLTTVNGSTRPACRSTPRHRVEACCPRIIRMPSSMRARLR